MTRLQESKIEGRAPQMLELLKRWVVLCGCERSSVDELTFETQELLHELGVKTDEEN
jgi:hypothetical protein